MGVKIPGLWYINSMKENKAAFFLMVFMVCLSGAAHSDSLLSWSVKGSMFIITADNGLKADPMPITVSAGVSAAYPIFDIFSVEGSLDFYGTTYGFPQKPDSLPWPVPYAEENRSTLVIGTLFGALGVLKLPLVKGLGFRAYAGPGADFRICLIAHDLKGKDRDDAADQTSRTARYFWGKGRWFYPMAGLGMDFPVLPKLLLGFDVRTWFPVYKLWTNEHLPGVEGWKFAAGIRVTIR